MTMTTIISTTARNSSVALLKNADLKQDMHAKPGGQIPALFRSALLFSPSTAVHEPERDTNHEPRTPNCDCPRSTAA